MAEASDRIRLGPVTNPVRAIIDASAGGLAVLGAWWLGSTPAADALLRRCLLVFSLSQVALFSVSFAYHAIPWSPLWKQRWQRLDHSMIYCKIAGSASPIVVIGLDDPTRSTLLVAIWGLAVLGAGQKLLLPWVHERWSIPVQVTQALLVLPALGPFAERHAAAASELLWLGGAAFTLGAVVFVSERPRLWPRVFSFHDLFHVLVVTGSVSLYVSIALHVWS